MDKIEHQMLRREWHNLTMDKFHACDIIFVDPDNGLIVSSTEDMPKSNKLYYHLICPNIIVSAPV